MVRPSVFTQREPRQRAEQLQCFRLLRRPERGLPIAVKQYEPWLALLHDHLRPGVTVLVKQREPGITVSIQRQHCPNLLVLVMQHDARLAVERAKDPNVRPLLVHENELLGANLFFSGGLPLNGRRP